MRKKPYTEIGVKRFKCFRKGCNNKASRQWQICSDKNTYRPICIPCDIEINRIVLEFIGFVNRKEMLEEYIKSL